ncbi:hypothetical protein WJX73_009028 [Symbiochloris irregularis]|uniref:4-hydroxyphenylpyruvate dioxygenase n=1 Tax=Symbiochloris irregularis TaxID=706552 RepID=A0AAW1P9N3_9CHLO
MQHLCPERQYCTAFAQNSLPAPTLLRGVALLPAHVISRKSHAQGCRGHRSAVRAQQGQSGELEALSELAEAQGFRRKNPLSDKFEVLRFHHIEWWCADATNAQTRFSCGLGMHMVAKSDLSTGNTTFASFVLQSHDMVFAFTAPQSQKQPGKGSAIPWYSRSKAFQFNQHHGLGVRAVGILVTDAAAAYKIAVQNGAVSAAEPVTLTDKATGQEQTVAEVLLYGDVVLRLVSGSFQGPFLASYTPVSSHPVSYGIRRVDHAVGNVPVMHDTVEYIKRFSGFHEFAEFTAEDVGTLDSGLNSMVLASNNEMVIMPINEPTFGTPRKSQIQTYLEQNEGPGLQHLALKTDNIFTTMKALRAASGAAGGFDFMPAASDDYYRQLPEKIGNVLTEEQYAMVKELGLLVDKDDQGVLLQIFTQPLGDRPTVFLEIIQRVGCMRPLLDPRGEEVKAKDSNSPVLVQAGGCGGFGKGNFSELFKKIEDYERTLSV